MDFRKILGSLILLIGMLMIAWALYSSYNIFTGKVLPPELFKIEKKEETEIERKPSLKPEEIQKEIELMIKKQLADLIPTNFITKILNLISWSIFSGILIFGGSKISEIGIKLIKG